MLDIDSLAKGLGQALPQASHDELTALASAILAAQSGESYVLAPEHERLLGQLAGQEVSVGETLLSFDGAQVGDVQIGDVVRGTLLSRRKMASSTRLMLSCCP